MGWLQDWLDVLNRPLKARSAEFILSYGPSKCTADNVITVGYLTYSGGVWQFRYADEYKTHPELRPLEGFEDVDRVYRSKTLFPFFAVRIPNSERRDIREILEQRRITSPDLIDMLRLFGAHAANAPDLCLAEKK